VFSIVVKQVTYIGDKKFLLKYQERSDNVSWQWIPMNPVIFGGHLQQVKNLLNNFKDALLSVYWIYEVHFWTKVHSTFQISLLHMCASYTGPSRI
jgi:hypothetical protein